MVAISGDEALPGCDIERRLARLCHRQHGVFTLGQALRLGLPASTVAGRTRRGTYERVHHGVYRVSAAPQDWHGQVMAACLAVGDRAAASHRCAARLWGLQGFEKASTELSVARTWRGALPLDIHRLRRLTVHEIVRRAGIPVTVPARTLLDLASTLATEVLEQSVDDALRRGLVTVRSLVAYLDGPLAAGRRGRRTLRGLATAGDAGRPESVLERRLLQAIRDAGLPRPTLQHEVRAAGVLVARIDVAYVEARLAIEAEGFRWHSGRQRTERDARRQSRLAAAGWRVMRVTWDQLERRPEEVIDAIRRALGSTPPGGARS